MDARVDEIMTTILDFAFEDFVRSLDWADQAGTVPEQIAARVAVARNGAHLFRLILLFDRKVPQLGRGGRLKLEALLASGPKQIESRRRTGLTVTSLDGAT
jgi:hypothetical protein